MSPFRSDQQPSNTVVTVTYFFYIIHGVVVLATVHSAAVKREYCSPALSGLPIDRIPGTRSTLTLPTASTVGRTTRPLVFRGSGRTTPTRRAATVAETRRKLKSQRLAEDGRAFGRVVKRESTTRPVDGERGSGGGLELDSIGTRERVQADVYRRSVMCVKPRRKRRISTIISSTTVICDKTRSLKS